MKIIEMEELEVKINKYVHRIIDFKSHFADILSRYTVSNPEEIKEMIRQKKIPAHPAYEDYLDAISYKLGIEEALKELEYYIEKLKEI